MADIRFACAGCLQSLEAAEELAGLVVACPTCGKSVAIPRAVGLVYQQAKPMTRRIPLTARARLDRRMGGRAG